MELKEYQEATLDSFRRWKEALDAANLTMKDLKARDDVDEDFIRNLHYPEVAWDNLAEIGAIAETAGDYVKRFNAKDEPIPHVCFKIPTGGGKTLLAVSALERLNEQNGFVLWIIPTKVIYKQTKDALKNRGHPYRQALERASGGRFKLLEKDDVFTSADIEHHLCVMLLMAPSANRRDDPEDFLLMNRDSGRYRTFFPDADNLSGNTDYITEHGLELSDGKLIKHSLSNVLKIIRPVVILDEAHMVYGSKRRRKEEREREEKTYVEFVNRLNPSLVIELSATPNKKISNLLVDITGLDLKKEEMVKLPINVTSLPGDWFDILEKAQRKLDYLNTEAQSLQMAEDRYIRPIAVVIVERTGEKKRDGHYIHSEDVREHLVQKLGVLPEQVAVQSTDLKELDGEELLSKSSQIRWIITKNALKEGWDCPFAYLLVMFDKSKTQQAITQYVGRVMRQPNARLTGREALDQCYVYCWNVDVGTAVVQVKKGLEREGLEELSCEVLGSSLSGYHYTETKEVKRRDTFVDQTIFLPRVLHISKGRWEELDYKRHILSAIKWEAIELNLPGRLFSAQAVSQTVKVDLDGKEPIKTEREIYIDKTIKYSRFARSLSNIIPNPWQAIRLVKQSISRYTDEEIYDHHSYLVSMLRKQISREIEKQAQQIFKKKLKKQEIRFDLETDQPNYELVESYTVLGNSEDPPLKRQYGSSLQLSLFEPVFERDLSPTLEIPFARYLDEHKALQWWHKVADKQKKDYYLKGWKVGRIFPDFIAMSKEKDGEYYLLIYETKGEHLRNPDAEYKSLVLETLQEAFNCGTMTVRDGTMKGVFRMVFSEEEFPAALAELGDDWT